MFDVSAKVTNAKWVPCGDTLKTATICLMKARMAAQLAVLEESTTNTMSRTWPRPKKNNHNIAHYFHIDMFKFTFEIFEIIYTMCLEVDL